MSDEQRKEFLKMIQDYGPGNRIADQLELMKAAYNAAVKKCAETADIDWVDEDGKSADKSIDAHHPAVDKDSILQNLIP